MLLKDPWSLSDLITVQLLEKWYDNKMVKSPYNWVILPLTQSLVANQQKKMDE